MRSAGLGNADLRKLAAGAGVTDAGETGPDKAGMCALGSGQAASTGTASPRLSVPSTTRVR